jgi:hypothetical protein
MTWRWVDDSIMILDLPTSASLSLNGTAAAIWQLLARGTTVAELVKSVTDEFEVEPDIAEADITAFLDDLRSRGFIA